MNDNHPQDRRVRKTQRLLREALVSLIHEKPYESVAVTEIVERADVGRSAFYMHFEGKDALLASAIREMLEATPPRALPDSATRFANVVRFSFPIFEYLNRFRHLADRPTGQLVRGSLRRRPAEFESLHHHLHKVLIDAIADDVASAVERTGNAATLPADLLVDYIVTTFILVLTWWLESTSALTAREVDDVFLSMVLPTLSTSSTSLEAP